MNQYHQEDWKNRVWWHVLNLDRKSITLDRLYTWGDLLRSIPDIKKIMSNLISRSSLIIFGNSSRYTGPICKTCLIFYGTFKSHESHCNTHIFKCYRRPVTECSLCMHSYNHIYHYESIACLGVSIPFFTNAIFSVWHRKYWHFLFKSGFLQCCKVFSGIFLWYEVPRKDYHGNIRSLLQGKQPQYRWKFYQMLQCDIFGLG